MNRSRFILVACLEILFLTVPAVVFGQAPSKSPYICGQSAWTRASTDGFGDPYSNDLDTLVVFGGQLYTGVSNPFGAELWRTSDGQTWQQVMMTKWPSSIDAVYDAKVFGEYLYFGTNHYLNGQLGNWGGEIWRTDGTSFERVAYGGLGDTDMFAMDAYAVFSNTLYVAASSDSQHMTQIFRSPSGDPGSWQPVPFGALGDGVQVDVVMYVYKGYLYLGFNQSDSAQLWRSSDGTNWNPESTDGFGDPNNTAVSAMAEFNGNLYIGLRNLTNGGQVWRSDGLGYTVEITGGMGNPDNQRPYGLLPYGNDLYLVFSNLATGAEVWRTEDGSKWECIEQGGWGDNRNGYADYFNKGAAVFKDLLYIAADNDEIGGAVWKYLPNGSNLYLPFVSRDSVTGNSGFVPTIPQNKGFRPPRNVFHPSQKHNPNAGE